MVSRWVVALFGLFHVVNGLTMLVAPTTWYASVPGVSMTGPFNPHFVTDIGLAFLASGIGMLFALRRGQIAATLALAGSVWPALHALFHVWSWVTGHMPSSPTLWASEAVGVVIVGLLGAGLALARFGQGET